MAKKNTKEQTDKLAALEQQVQELEQKNQELTQKNEELEDFKLRQMAEFDNYRRRTQKEKLELMDNAGERIFTDMLPLADDWDRMLAAMDKYDDVAALKEGAQLVYDKFIKFLSDNKVTPIETQDKDFNTDEHEAITTFAAGQDKKGKVIDCTQKGYKLNEKVIRYAKVVVGE
ncbi:MAG: nucleotide exchange factor GrpE [Paludibacteraceae bacterium]|nr:nucleotide exchange factor GrpE [Paludibacteraceae bacterium]